MKTDLLRREGLADCVDQFHTERLERNTERVYDERKNVSSEYISGEVQIPFSRVEATFPNRQQD